MIEAHYIILSPHDSAHATGKDNDMYGHVNNAVYYSFFDTCVNHFLINEAGLRPLESDAIALVIESQCTYSAPLAYPETLDIGLRAGKVGNSSIRWECAVFQEGMEQSAAHGYFVHVFVNSASRRTVPIPAPIRDAVTQLQG